MTVSNFAPFDDPFRDDTPSTLADIVWQLRPVHIGALLAVLAITLAAATGLGYVLNDRAVRPTLVQLEADKADLERRAGQLERMRTKDELVSRYLRYMIAADDYFSIASSENLGALRSSRAELVAYVEYLLRRGEEVAGDATLRGLVGGAALGAGPEVTFGYDGSTWPLPRTLAVTVPEPRERRPARYNGWQ